MTTAIFICLGCVVLGCVARGSAYLLFVAGVVAWGIAVFLFFLSLGQTVAVIPVVVGLLVAGLGVREGLIWLTHRWRRLHTSRDGAATLPAYRPTKP